MKRGQVRARWCEGEVKGLLDQGEGGSPGAVLFLPMAESFRAVEVSNSNQQCTSMTPRMFSLVA